MGYESVMLAALLVANIVLEWKLMHLNRWFRRFVQRRKWLSLMLSIMISLVVGHLFGAAGVMCLAVGLVSTLIMQIVWNIVSLVEKILLALHEMVDHYRFSLRRQQALVVAV